MTMPGFVFHFRCYACGRTSEDYSTFPFPDILRPDILLPAWSLEHKCWSQIQLSLNQDQRTKLEADAELMTSFARSLSSHFLTVCIPHLRHTNGKCSVTVTPDPICPHCGLECHSVFGYSPSETKLTTKAFIPEEVDIIPLSAIDISVRTRHICSELGLLTLGQLRDGREQLMNHRQTTDSVVEEIDRWLTTLTDKTK
jgi:hypothetical protein